jgi:dynein heavy chain
MPVFGGTRGQEWENNLQDLKKMFDKHLDGIKNLDYDILDVKITKWHDDYGQMFKDQIKNIEVIYATIIQMTLRHVSTVEDGVEMLENFYQLAKRPTIIDHVQKKGAEQVYQLFTAEIKEVENMFESQHKKRPPMPVSWSHYGGIAIWVHSLIVRLDRAKDSIDGLYFVPDDGTQSYRAEAIEQYEKLRHALDQYIAKGLFEDWNNSLGELKNLSEVEGSLEVHILQKSTEESLRQEPRVLREGALFAKSRKDGLLSSNFSTKLLRNLIEV